MLRIPFCSIFMFPTLLVMHRPVCIDLLHISLGVGSTFRILKVTKRVLATSAQIVQALNSFRILCKLSDSGAAFNGTLLLGW